MKILCIVQARMGSSRLPGKVLADLNGEPVLSFLIRRLRRSKLIDAVVVATTENGIDNSIAKWCESAGIPVFRGSEDDVLDRFYQCSKAYPDYEVIVRITGDCPLTDPAVVDALIEHFATADVEYANNVDPTPTFPDGLDAEVFRVDALAAAAAQAIRQSEREHVTLHFRENPSFSKSYIAAPRPLGHLRLTLDEPGDLEVLRSLVAEVGSDATYEQYADTLMQRPDLLAKNNMIRRDVGLQKSLREEKQ